IEDRALADKVRAALRSHETILLNATSVWKSLEGIRHAILERDWSKLVDFFRIPCPKPPYRKMWLEGMDPTGTPAGALVSSIKGAGLEGAWKEFLDRHPTRLDYIRQDSPADVIKALVWMEVHGHAGPLGEIAYWLNGDGDYLSSDIAAWPPC